MCVCRSWGRFRWGELVHMYKRPKPNHTHSCIVSSFTEGKGHCALNAPAAEEDHLVLAGIPSEAGSISACSNCTCVAAVRDDDDQSTKRLIGISCNHIHIHTHHSTYICTPFPLLTSAMPRSLASAAPTPPPTE